jgi:hypothetical protein
MKKEFGESGEGKMRERPSGRNRTVGVLTQNFAKETEENHKYRVLEHAVSWSGFIRESPEHEAEGPVLYIMNV